MNPLEKKFELLKVQIYETHLFVFGETHNIVEFKHQPLYFFLILRWKLLKIFNIFMNIFFT